MITTSAAGVQCMMREEAVKLSNEHTSIKELVSGRGLCVENVGNRYSWKLGARNPQRVKKLGTKTRNINFPSMPDSLPLNFIELYFVCITFL
jgi:hypothetical protein